MSDVITQKALDLGILKNQGWLARFAQAKSFDTRLQLLRAYNTQNQQEEALLQLLIDRLDPPKSSVNNVSVVRKEMEILEAKGYKIDTPAEEEKWQKKLDAASILDAAFQKEVLDQHMRQVQELFPDLDVSMFLPGGAVEVSSKVPLKDNSVPGAAINVGSPAAQTAKKMDVVPTPLERLEGLPAIAMEKLKAANITTVEDFFALGQKGAQEIIQNEVTVARFANRLKSNPGVMI